MDISQLLITALLSAFTLSSCKPAENQGPGTENPAGAPLVFKAVLPDAPSVFKNVWAAGDELEVFCLKNNLPVRGVLKASAVTGDGKTAEFAADESIPADSEVYYAVLPDCGVDGYKLLKYWNTVDLNASDTAIPSVTVAGTGRKEALFSFRHIFSMLEFTVENAETDHVVLRGNNGEVLCKELFVAFEDFSVSDNPSPHFQPASYIKRKVDGPGKYHIGLFPGLELSLGYTLTAYNAAGEELSKAVSYEKLSVGSGTLYTAAKFGDNGIVLSPEFDESKIVLSLASISDIHVNGTANESGNKFRSALEQLKAKAAAGDGNGIDGVMIVGDLTNQASAGEISAVKTLYESVFDPAAVPMIYTIGNHDAGTSYKWSLSTVDDAKAFSNAFGPSYFLTDVDNEMRNNFECRHCVVVDYDILCLTPNGTSPVVYSENVISWLDGKLEALTRKNPNRYVIVLTHPMIYNTVYGSMLGDYWATKSLSSVLEKYPQAITFGGHLHFPLNDPRSIWQGKFTSLGCGSVLYMAIESGGYEDMAGATIMNDRWEFSQGLLLQFDISGNLRVTRMDFYHNAEIGEPWTLSYPSEELSHLEKYSHLSRKEANSAPTLASMEVSVGEASSAMKPVSVTFAAGNDDEFVHHYVIRVKKGSETVAEKKILADFYRSPKASGMKTSWTRSLGAFGAGSYEVSCVAYDSWDAASNVLVKNFTIEGLASPEVTAYADMVFSSSGISDEQGNLTVTNKGAVISNTPVIFGGKTYNSYVAHLSSGKYTMLEFNKLKTLDNFKAFTAAGFSVEALYVDKSPGTGVHGIVCGTEAGGWGLAVRATGVPYFIVGQNVNNKNSYLAVDAKSPASTSALTHVVAVYDPAGGKIRIYVNGTLDAEAQIKGAYFPGIGDTFNRFCLGADIKPGGNGTDFPCVDMLVADAKIYAGALDGAAVAKAYADAKKLFE